MICTSRERKKVCVRGRDSESEKCTTEEEEEGGEGRTQ